MLEKIKKVLFESYGSEEEKGIFLSWYDDQQDLIISQWVLTSDMPLHELLDTIYDEIQENMSSIIYVAVDIVSEIIQLEDSNDILTKDPQEFGFAVVWENDTSGVILPGVMGVADAKHALYHVKKKYAIEWNVEVFVFRTERLVVSK